MERFNLLKTEITFCWNVFDLIQMAFSDAFYGFNFTKFSNWKNTTDSKMLCFFFILIV